MTNKQSIRLESSAKWPELLREDATPPKTRPLLSSGIRRAALRQNAPCWRIEYFARRVRIIIWLH